MTTYWEQLRDPRWQKARLEVMERARFRCEHCGDDTKTLNVHHTYYAKGRKPWEYEADSLRCLCEDCHKESESYIADIKRRMGGLSSYRLGMVAGFVRALEYADHMGECDDAMPPFAGDGAIIAGMAQGFGVTVNDLIECTDPHTGVLSGLAAVQRGWKRRTQAQVHEAMEMLDQEKR